MQWLLLLHQVPPKPPYLRAKILRRLNQLGALPVKKSAYLLPQNEATLEDFQWTARQIEDEGGSAWLFVVEAIAGFDDESICASFRKLRSSDYAELIQAAQKLASAPEEGEWKRLSQRYSELRRIDFFDAPEKEEMERLMDTIDRALHSSRERVEKPRLAGLSGRTWVTRKGINVDRIASAWFIQKFIDPEARFQFVDSSAYAHAPEHIRFDMFEGEFTHEGELCTFEVLLSMSARSGDAALQAIGEIVHDIDLREPKYQRAETPGVASMIDGLVRLHADDARRLEEGSALFESLFASRATYEATS
jgi:hypothetical protein